MWNGMVILGDSAKMQAGGGGNCMRGFFRFSLGLSQGRKRPLPYPPPEYRRRGKERGVREGRRGRVPMEGEIQGNTGRCYEEILR